MKILSQIKLLTIAILSACFVTTATQYAVAKTHPHTLIALDSEGGAGNTGGGGSIPTGQVSIEDFKEHLTHALVEVRPFFYGFQHSFDLKDPQITLAQVLYDRKPTIFDILPQVTIELRENSACSDRKGNEVEASVVTSKKNQICMSYALLKNRLDQWTFRAQLSALLVHEMMHLVQVNEDEDQANALQRFALEIFLKLFQVGSNENIVRHNSEFMKYDIDQIISGLNSIENSIKNNQFNGQEEYIRNFFLQSYRWSSVSLVPGLENFLLFLVDQDTFIKFNKHQDNLDIIHDYLSKYTNELPPNTTPELLISYIEAYKSDLLEFSKTWKSPDQVITDVVINSEVRSIKLKQPTVMKTQSAMAVTSKNALNDQDAFTTLNAGEKIFTTSYLSFNRYPVFKAYSEKNECGGLSVRSGLNYSIICEIPASSVTRFFFGLSTVVKAEGDHLIMRFSNQYDDAAKSPTNYSFIEDGTLVKLYCKVTEPGKATRDCTIKEFRDTIMTRGETSF